MTKEELLSDVKIGDVVKVYTESNETFEGTIVDFGETGLKINLLDSSKAKRIVYGRIIEYDLVSSGEKLDVKGGEDKADPKQYKGVISFYKKEAGYGMIKDLYGETVFFHVRQVKDVDLQRILAVSVNYKKRVSYTLGINYKGSIAADAIELDYACEGYIENYDISKKWGQIRSGEVLYNFVFAHLDDPLLRAEIMSKPDDVLKLQVRFYAGDYTNRKTRKTSKIATDIMGAKEYSLQEIDGLVNGGFVSQQVVDEWLHAQDNRAEEIVSDGYFKPVQYEPLSSSGAITLDKERVGTKDEEKAVALVLPQNTVNPFASLPKESSDKDYYADAYRYLVGYKNSNGDVIGVDLDLSEELFIKSIQNATQIESSVANLINIYMKKGGEYIVKGLQLLEVYGDLFPSEKLTNLRIQLIEKSGNEEALEQILLSAIPNCTKKNTAWNFMARLTGVYCRQQKWELAIEWCNKRIEYLNKYKTAFPNYAFMRNSTLRSCAVAEYCRGNKETAIQQAKLLQERLPDDPIIKSLIEGTFEYGVTQRMSDDIANIDVQYEDMLTSEEDDFSKFLKAKLQEVDLITTFNKVNAVYSKMQDSAFVGNADDVKQAVDSIRENIRRGRKAVSAEHRSKIYIGIARMILDSRNNNTNESDTKCSIEMVRRYVGKYARNTADDLVEKNTTIDSIRYMYILALRYLSKEDRDDIAESTNMLVASFFVEGRMLADELHKKKRKAKIIDAYYEQECFSTKDFLIATFMLQDRREYVSDILTKIFDTPGLRNKFCSTMSIICGQERDVSSFYEFEELWKAAKSRYINVINQIGKEIAETVNEYYMVESIRQHVSRIKELMDVHVLWNQDEIALTSYIDILSAIGDTFEKYTVKEKIEGFRTIELAIQKLKNDIKDSPTEISYDHIYSRLDSLGQAVRSQFDELYRSSRPECEIYLSNNAVYVNEKKAEIAITFKNANNKQDADAVEIDLSGSEGTSFIKCEKKFTSIRSGEAQDYIAFFSLDERVVSEGQFDVKVGLKYQYKEGVDSIQTFSTTEMLPVNISDKENFVKIPNKYVRIFRGNSVDDPELFKGRNELIESICKSLSTDGIMTKNRGIILWGQRRVGKNSVKDYLKERIRAEYPDAYLIIEIGSLGKCHNLREVLATIVNSTGDALDLEYPDVYDKLIKLGMGFNGEELEKNDGYMPEFSRFMDRLSKNLKKISDPEKNILLFFIDEFSYLYEWIEKGDLDGKVFMRFWKSFIQDYGICAIIIAQDNIPVWKARYENEFACMNHDNEISFLDFEGAKALICEPCQVDGKELFTPEAVRLIYDWTKGSAYLIVIFCKYIIDYLNENYTEKATKTIVQIVFEKEFLDKKGMFGPEDFEPQIQDVANVGEEAEVINNLNVQLLKEIAVATITSPQTRIETLSFFNECGDKALADKVFSRLRDRKIIEVERDTYCSISMPLLKFYLLRTQSRLDRDVLGKLMR
jgi:hypothetical protein